MAHAHIVVDYQNIHLTGHNTFCIEGEAKHLCLVHPLHFATQVINQRNLIRRLISERDGTEFVPLSLGSVSAFRGQPSNRHDPNGYRRTQAQQSEWTRDPRVRVRYRSLKYYEDGSIKEKGIDVLVALEVVTKAAEISRNSHGDVVILAAHDTDQEPALELARRLAGEGVETAGWAGQRVLRVPGEEIWHTKLDGDAFKRSWDGRVY